MRIIAAFVLWSAFAASPAAADDNCTCRAHGRSFQMGETVCLRSPSGQSRLATCGMVLNNSAWQFSETPCVSSRNFTPVRLASIRN